MNPTPEQEKIYNFIKFDTQHGIIDAVAGSGKTSTIIESISYVDKNKELLFCAFNKSIRDEIQNRISKNNNGNIVVKNLHQLGFDILKTNSETNFIVEELKFKKLIDKGIENKLLDELEKYLDLYKINKDPKESTEERILKENIRKFKYKLNDCINKFRLTLTKENFEDFKNMILHFGIVDEKKTEPIILDSVIQIFLRCTKIVLEKGNELAEKLKIIDLTDMIYLPQKLKLYPIKTYDILFVDECQDLSKAQLAIALKYVKKNGRVIAVGDPQQSIYGFTGADIESFSRFEKLLQNHIKLTLSFCFRCPDNVIEYAQNFRNDIKPFKEKIGIIEKIDFEKVLEFVKEKDLIISRTKAPLSSLLFDLLESGKKVNIDQEEISELFNELRFLFSKEELRTEYIYKNNNDFFEKVFKRNEYFIQKKSEKISNKLLREEYIDEETIHLKRRVDFINRQTSIFIDAKNLNELIKKIEKLVSDDPNAIKLSTIHKAKGLENERVFILDYDKLPLKKDNHKMWEKIQEDNLKYVALTRTKNTLYLVNAVKDEKNIEEGNLFDQLDDIW